MIALYWRSNCRTQDDEILLAVHLFQRCRKKTQRPHAKEDPAKIQGSMRHAQIDAGENKADTALTLLAAIDPLAFVTRFCLAIGVVKYTIAVALRKRR